MAVIGGRKNGGNWSGYWRNYGFSSGPFISIGGFGYPYYWGWYPSSGLSISWGWYPSWGWSVPYALSYGYASYGYYPSYGYDYGYPYYGNRYPDWAWSVPYAFNYDYYSYGYNSSDGYDYGYSSDRGYDTAWIFDCPIATPAGPSWLLPWRDRWDNGTGNASRNSRIRTRLRQTDYAVSANLIDLSVG